jgi:hypothetical protein
MKAVKAVKACQGQWDLDTAFFPSLTQPHVTFARRGLAVS